MRLMGPNGITRGGGGLADAVDAAPEDFASNTEHTHYLVGSVVGSDPLPRIVREFQSVIGEEAHRQVTADQRATGRLRRRGLDTRLDSSMRSGTTP